MEPYQRITSCNTDNWVESAPNETNIELSPKTEKITKLVQETLSKYPQDSIVKKLDSTFPIKQVWLYNEWDSVCQFSKYISPHFPDRKELDPSNPNPNRKLIESVFYTVRGQYTLWEDTRENARWKKIETKSLTLDWIKNNVKVLFPTKDQFSVSELNGIVLWKEKTDDGKKYKLYEGNHRISAWLASNTPQNIPAVIFIGKPKK